MSDKHEAVNIFSSHVEAEAAVLELQKAGFDMHIARLLLAELKPGDMMSQLYVESLTQVLVIHLLRHYSTFTQTITSENRSLTRTQLQQAIDYIHTHLGQDLSLVQIARVINISPTYFASLFKRATGLSPHQYVIKHRVEHLRCCCC
jgi:AraC family transcriptional regulator